jgi:exopolyphosphatase / guanosine-5'-triphosphate,3'-diphosphate pyrophosphatase
LYQTDQGSEQTFFIKFAFGPLELRIEPRFSEIAHCLIARRRKKSSGSNSFTIKGGLFLAQWRTKRLAIIDLGTNSVRFDIHETLSKGTTRLLHREKLMVRLGENVFVSGRLGKTAVLRTLQALTSFKQRADELKVDKLVAFATSALRDAEDRDVFLETVRQKLGIRIHIISGKEEATLIAEGILRREKRPKGIFGLIDIGGGSTEISICQESKILFCESFPLGVARLQQVFLRAIPPEEGKTSVKHLRGHIRAVLGETVRNEHWPKVGQAIGSSGTVRALSRMCRKTTSKEISPKWLAKLVRTMTPCSLSEIRSLPGMDPKRADLMLAGAVVLEESLRALKAHSAISTEFSLREGILDGELKRIEPERVHGKWDFTPYVERAVAFGEDRHRCRWLLRTSLRLFRRLKTVHKLDERWFPYLAIGLLFRNVGRFVSFSDFEKHSAYLVRHGELPFSEAWEADFVAELCRLSQGTKASLGSLTFENKETRSKLLPFTKILALLRLLDGLERTEPKRVEAERIEVTRKSIRFWLTKGDSTELAVLHLHQKKALFEKVFRTSFTAQIRK